MSTKRNGRQTAPMTSAYGTFNLEELIASKLSNLIESKLGASLDSLLEQKLAELLGGITQPTVEKSTIKVQPKAEAKAEEVKAESTYYLLVLPTRNSKGEEVYLSRWGTVKPADKSMGSSGLKIQVDYHGNAVDDIKKSGRIDLKKVSWPEGEIKAVFGTGSAWEGVLAVEARKVAPKAIQDQLRDLYKTVVKGKCERLAGLSRTGDTRGGPHCYRVPSKTEVAR